MGGLCSSAGGVVCAGGIDIIKLTKAPLIYSVCLGGLSPPKPLMATGLSVKLYLLWRVFVIHLLSFIKPTWCVVF